ncbi:TTF-type zinc finger protein with HAT dimerisation domain, partial [Striga hermonthica]
RGSQSKLERFLKRKSPPPNEGKDNGNNDGDTSRTRRDGTASDTNHTSHRFSSSRISRQEVNFDELPYDPADRRRISDYIGDQLQNDVRRKYLTRGPCKPPSSFKFPQTMIAGFPRRCQHEWFNMYGWLEYSEKVDKCFCLYCYLFRDCNKGHGGNDAFVIDGWDGWKKSDRLRDHVSKKCDSFHNTTVKRCDNLLKPGQSIGEAMNKGSSITKENNLIRLKTSIKAVRFLLHQGLAFRGHDEREKSTNKGNFRELVDLLAEENDKVKKVVDAPKNNKMIAPEIQRDIANCFAE